MAENYILLDRITLTASAASVTFSNIPQSGYTDLKLVMSARTTGTNGNAQGFCYLAFNGSTANFTSRRLYQDGTTAGSDSAGRFLAYVPNSQATANNFGVLDLYIPNYTSSNYKSWSADQNMENNSSTYYLQGMSAGLWSNTAAITSITIDNVIDSSGTVFAFASGSTFSLYGLAAVGTTPGATSAPKASGGDIIKTDGTYWYHAFTYSGTFTPVTNLTCDYLVVAGGGGGGGGYGAGGGAGGLRSTVTATGGGGSLESMLSVTSGTSYTITVGSGGAGGVSVAGTQGSSSVFSTITSIGGGYGAAFAANGGTGGSGGGAAGRNSYTGGSGTANQGYAGGNSNYSNSNITAVAGGGGAGAVGGNAVNNGGTSGTSGSGGNGVAISALATATNTGVSSYYAGGGGGASRTVGETTPAGSGGSGGGGAGNPSDSNLVATAGTANTGGGGGGSGGSGANGGSGIVIIRYSAA